PQLGVFRIFERNDRVQPVVAASELDDDKDGVLCAGLACVGRSEGRAAEEGGNAQSQCNQAAVSQEIAAVHGHDRILAIGYTSLKRQRRLPSLALQACVQSS